MKKVCVTSDKKHRISPYLYMQFMEPLGTADTSVDAGWDYLNNCWHQKLGEKIKELGPTMIRYGGCFASYYHWKEAVGPREQRVPVLNQEWDGLFSNQVGTHEILELCRMVGAEPLLGVNTESDGRMCRAYPKEGIDRFGTAEEAAEWVAYCNDPDNRLRLSHGVKDPYNVHYWQIGNETSYVPYGYKADKSAQVNLKFAKAMHAVDPSLTLLGWGDDCRHFGENWATKLCEVAGDEIDIVAFHYHYEALRTPDCILRENEYRKDPAKTWDTLMEIYKLMETRIQQVRAETDPFGKKLALTESHLNVPGRNRCELLSAWGTGVAYARSLNIVEHHSDVIEIATSADFFGNCWQVNALLLPTPIKRGNAYLQPVGELMKLFRHHIGAHALDASGMEKQDLTASISENGKTVYLHLVNPSASASDDLDIQIDGQSIKSMKVFEIAKDPTAEIMGTCPDLFLPEEKTIDGSVYHMPPASVAAIEINLA